jgi:hypothetical protein
MLAGVLAKAVCDWSWHTDRIDNRTKVFLDGLVRLVGEIAKDTTGSMVDEVVAIALCDLLP